MVGGARVVTLLGLWLGLATAAALATEPAVAENPEVAAQVPVEDEITVRAASRHSERIVEAPAAVATLTQEEIARRGSLGQLPRLLATAPGVELAQAGLFDYNLNVRGFNGSTNRRVLTLIDGRDPSQPVFAGAQEWAAISFPLDDLASVELVYGPGAALYGAGAYNGVLDLRTKSVRESLGGRARLGLGELGLTSLEARSTFVHPRLGAFRLHGSALESRDFTRSRVESVEYHPDLLGRELIAPVREHVRISTAGLRWDHDLAPDRALTAEAGTAELSGVTVVTGLGRLQRLDVERPWARLELTSPRWSVLGSFSGRRSPAEVSLAAGSAIALDSSRSALEAQGNLPLLEGRALVVGGVSWMRQEVDSRDSSGVHTLFLDRVDSEHQAVFGQGQVDLGSRLRAVVSLRWDESDLHDSRLSPRAALVGALSENQSLRLSWGEAFQSPSLSEKYVRVAVAPPIDLSALELALAPLLGGVSLGLESVPLLAVGNAELEVEQAETVELGYTGVVGSSTFLSANVYRSELSDFTTNLIPMLGTSLGPLAPFERWRPAGLSAEAEAALAQALAAALPPTFVLAAGSDGRPYIPLLSFGRFGRVVTEGLELGIHTARGPWRFELGYSYFDARVQSQAPENPLAANRARHQGTGSIAGSWPRLSASLDLRWSEGFPYRSGVFVGPVESYTVLDAGVQIPLGSAWLLDVGVANVLDERYYESFGGDILERRAVARLRVNW